MKAAEHHHEYDHVHEHADWHFHEHDANHPHEHGGVNDYMQAVAEYRKTFASKEDVLAETPDPAVREMLRRLGWPSMAPMRGKSCSR